MLLIARQSKPTINLSPMKPIWSSGKVIMLKSSGSTCTGMFVSIFTHWVRFRFRLCRRSLHISPVQVSTRRHLHRPLLLRSETDSWWCPDNIGSTLSCWPMTCKHLGPVRQCTVRSYIKYIHLNKYTIVPLLVTTKVTSRGSRPPQTGQSNVFHSIDFTLIQSMQFF